MPSILSIYRILKRTGKERREFGRELAELPRTEEGQVAVTPTAAEMGKQTVRGQLVGALERISAALGSGENILVRQRRPELAEAYHRIKAVADAALDRHRAEPEEEK